MTDAYTHVRVPKYRAVSTFLKMPLEDEKFESLIEQINENKDDGIVIIKIGDRDVCSLKIEGKKVFINEIIDETKNELDVISQFPVSYRVVLKSLIMKYIESLQEDIIEDSDFLKMIKENNEEVNEDNLKFILNVWGRFWEVRTRFRGDSNDGIYIIKERDVYDENDKNTLNIP